MNRVANVGDDVERDESTVQSFQDRVINIEFKKVCKVALVNVLLKELIITLIILRGVFSIPKINGK